MNKAKIKALTATLSVLSTTLWSLPAWTCTVDPEPVFQLADEVVPSTVAGALFRTCNGEFSEDYEFAVVDDASDQEIAVSAEEYRFGIYEIAFEEALEASRTYRFEVTPKCAFGGGEQGPKGEWFFQTDQAADIPESIGTWTANDPAQGQVSFENDASCSIEGEAAFVDFFFSPTEQGETWGQALAFETYVQEELWMPPQGLGQPFVGHSRLGWGREQVYSVCDDEPVRPPDRGDAADLEQGINYIQIVAWLPGTDQVWSTENELFVLRCDDEEEESDDEGDDPDADDGDDSTSEEDGSDEDDSGADEPVCASTSSKPSPWWVLIVVGLVGSMARSRRGRRRIKCRHIDNEST